MKQKQYRYFKYLKTFTLFSYRKIQNDRRLTKQKRKKGEKRNENIQNEQLFPRFSLAQIELEPNASKFAIFSAIRSAVLEADTKYSIFYEKTTKKHVTTSKITNCCFVCAGTCKVNNLVECACHINNDKNKQRDDNSDADSDTEEISEKESIPKVPQIVGAGLKSLFELIADARNIHPNLCTKALKALLDVIQGKYVYTLFQKKFYCFLSFYYVPIFILMLRMETWFLFIFYFIM